MQGITGGKQERVRKGRAGRGKGVTEGEKRGLSLVVFRDTKRSLKGAKREKTYSVN